jgi:hypothetical protein
MDNRFIERLWRSLKYEDVYINVTVRRSRLTPREAGVAGSRGETTII